MAHIACPTYHFQRKLGIITRNFKIVHLQVVFNLNLPILREIHKIDRISTIHPIYNFRDFPANDHSDIKAICVKYKKSGIKDEFVKIRDSTLVITFVIFAQK